MPRPPKNRKKAKSHARSRRRKCSPESSPAEDGEAAALGFDPSELSASERLGIGILFAEAHNLRTAIDLEYVDRDTYEILGHRLRLKRNGYLSGGFGCEMKPEDLPGLVDFWLGPEPNWCLPRDYNPLSPEDWRRTILRMRVSRGKSRIPPRAEPEALPKGTVWMSRHALERIREHPFAPPSTLSVYVALAELREESPTHEMFLTVNEICRLARASRDRVKKALAVLRELQLVRTKRRQRGLEIVLLHSR